GFICFFWIPEASGWGIIAFFLAIFATFFTALVWREKRGGFVWLLLFLVLGITRHQSALIFTDLLLGVAYGLFFFFVQKNSRNFVKFSFAGVVRPALRIFLLMIIAASAVGIFTGVPSQTIEANIQSGIQNFEDIRLPWFSPFTVRDALGGKEIGDMLSQALEKSRHSLLAQGFFPAVITQIIAERVENECGQDQLCEARIAAEVQREFGLEPPSAAPFPVEKQNASEVAGEAAKTELQNFLQSKFAHFAGGTNLSLLAAVIFFLVLLPLNSLLAVILSYPLQLCFWLSRKAKLIRTKEQTVSQ